jgi:hypothetical protein
MTGLQRSVKVLADRKALRQHMEKLAKSSDPDRSASAMFSLELADCLVQLNAHLEKLGNAVVDLQKELKARSR